MARFKGKTFKNEKIIIDDNEYMKCQFVNCTFVYGGGDYSIIDCNFSNSPESPFLELGDSADRTVHFLSVIHNMNPHVTESLFAVIRERGSAGDATIQ